MINLQKMPKVELHLHLDGSVKVEMAAKILNKDINYIKNEMIAKDKCQDLNEYLTKFELSSEILQTKENLQIVSHQLVNDLKSDGVIYAEIRFAPMKHIKKGLTKEEVIESVLKGLDQEEVKTNLILCMMRDASYEENKQVIDLAEEYLNKGVCAIDLAGAEALYKTEKFQKLFVYASSKNIPFTIHAGEADGKDSIKKAIEFGALRLGHGIRITEDEKLIEQVKEKNIHLEICPTSNVQTNVIDLYSNHPIKKFLKENISLSINTDNRTVSNITLTKEYEKLVKYLNFTEEDLIKTNIMAINHSFLSKDEKEILLEEYNKILNKLT